MWRGDQSPYLGQHYQLVRPLNSPNSLQRPHPPILIGGSGERKTLRLVARYADACNLFDMRNNSFHDDLEHKLRVLRDHCDAAGRDQAEIEKTVTTALELGEDRQAGLADLLSHLAELAALGIDHVLVSPRARPVLTGTIMRERSGDEGRTDEAAACRVRGGTRGQCAARRRGRAHLGGGGAAGRISGGSAGRSPARERGEQRLYRRRRLVLRDRRGGGGGGRRCSAHRSACASGGACAGAGGLAAGTLASRFLIRRAGWSAAAGLVLGAVAAAVLALWIGENIGLGTYNHLLATSQNGAFFHASLGLGAKSALAFWPMLTSAVILMAESGARRSAGPDRPDAPGPDVSGMWTSGPEGGHSP